MGIMGTSKIATIHPILNQVLERFGLVDSGGGAGSAHSKVWSFLAACPLNWDPVSTVLEVSDRVMIRITRRVLLNRDNYMCNIENMYGT
jgi:hypothetical protein